MKTIKVLFGVMGFYAGFASAAPLQPTAIFEPPAVEKPFFVEDELMIQFKDSVSEQDRSDYLALLADKGITSVDELSQRTHLLKLEPKALFGYSFQTVQATSDLLDSVSPNVLFFIQQPPYSVNRTLNLSSRAFVGEGEKSGIGGFVVPGSVPKLVVVRASGPSMSDQDISEPLADPYLMVFDRTPNLVFANDNWTDLKDWEKALFSDLIDAPKSEKESVVVTYLDPGTYGAIVFGADGGQGIALLEVYIQDYYMLELQPAQE